MNTHSAHSTNMTTTARRLPLLPLLLAATLALAPVLAPAQQAAPAGDAGALRGKLQALAPQLARNAFKRPLAIDSNEASDRLSWHVYPRDDHPFNTVDGALCTPDA